MNMYLSRALWVLLPLSFLVIAGCKSYEPKPVVWDEVSSVWQKPLSVTDIDLDDALQFALALNPEINNLRLKKLSSDKYAASSGWWNDPSFGFDAMRILDGGSHPYFGGLGFTFTLPVNGVPKLQKLAAERYCEADRFSVMAAERDLSMKVVKSWVALVYAGERVKLMEKTLDNHLVFTDSVAGLVSAGEMSKSVGDRLSLERLQRRYKVILEKQRMAEERNEFLRFLGVHPDVDLNLSLSVDSLSQWQVPPVVTNELQLLKHPCVQEQLARVDASEHELRIEIRRQYPDIEIGPRYENEEGSDRLGFEAGVALPLWNRNRQAIAAAEGNRDIQRGAAIAIWMKLVQLTHKVYLDVENARSRVELLEKERIPTIEAITSRMEKLFKKGECDITDLLEAQHSLFDARVELLEAREDLLKNLVEAHYIVHNSVEDI